MRGDLPQMKKIKRFFAFLLLIILIAVGIAVYTGYSKYKSALEGKSLDAAVEQIRAQENYTPLEQIPKIYLDAVVSVEDRRFYYHPGIDPIGIMRAIITDIKEKKLVEGGSSITQQLAKNMYFIKDSTPSRKIAEMFMALKLEKEYSKDEILELYFNGIYYGSGYYNIYDASVGYFGKSPIEMTDYEATLLAGIPNAPSVYSLNTNPDLAARRQEKVIDTMVDCGYISDEEGEKLKNEHK